MRDLIHRGPKAGWAVAHPAHTVPRPLSSDIVLNLLVNIWEHGNELLFNWATLPQKSKTGEFPMLYLVEDNRDMSFENDLKIGNNTNVIEYLLYLTKIEGIYIHIRYGLEAP